MAILLAALANLLEEDLILLSRAGNTLPDRVHCSTPRRWAYQGVKRGDRWIKLATVDIGGQVYTSREAMARFFAELTASRSGRIEATPPRCDRQKADAARRAAAIFEPKPTGNNPDHRNGLNAGSRRGPKKSSP